jgi:hypothetical protein
MTATCMQKTRDGFDLQPHVGQSKSSTQYDISEGSHMDVKQIQGHQEEAVSDDKHCVGGLYHVGYQMGICPQTGISLPCLV